MPLETGTFVSDLVSSNPAHSDSVGAADSHLRLIKACLLSTFTGITGVVTATHTQLNAAVAACVTGLAQAVHIAGSVGAPGVSFLGSLTTGLYSPAANQVALAANGVQALLATSAGVTVNGSIQGGTGQLGIIGEPRLWLSNTLPSGSFAWLNGQAINRAANPTLFTMWGTSFGVGDGSTTFNIPNWQGVTPIGRATMGGAADPGLVTNAGISTLGTIIGEGKHTLAVTELPAHTHSGTTATESVKHTHSVGAGAAGFVGFAGGSGGTIGTSAGQTTGLDSVDHTHAFTTDNGTGGAQSHNVVQPSFVCNWITLLG